MAIRTLKKSTFVLFITWAIVCGTGCSGGPEIRRQAYAELKNDRTYEETFPVVWKALENVLHNYRITNRNPDEVEPQDLKKLRERSLETDWVYGQSRDKYQEYTVNGLPKKTYLQTRFKFKIAAKSVLGGVHVAVDLREEIEALKADGSSDGYSRADQPDSSRSREILDKLQTAILAAPNT